MTTVRRATAEELLVAHRRAVEQRDEAQRRNESALDLHQPRRSGRHRAGPNCAECGNPHPCETRRRLEGKT